MTELLSACRFSSATSARESLTADQFDARFANDGSASENIKGVKDDVVALLEVAKGTPCTSEEVY
jgi:hypothetical protein